VRTLVVGHHRVLVGDVDGITGLTGHKSLPDADDLEHPKAKITAMRFYTLETLDLAGNSIAGGLEQAIVTGIGAVTDGVRMIYSPTLKRLFKAPPHTNSFVAVNSASGSFTPAVAYGAIPGGHGAGVSHNYNYANVRIDFNLGSTADEAYQLGLFRDGTLLQEWNNLAILDTMTVFYNDVAVVPGAHTYDIRIKKTTGTNALNVRQSFFMISTAQG
jgi:hypothetical protein